jgi:CpeT/CpcT family protein DUF1001
MRQLSVLAAAVMACLALVGCEAQLKKAKSELIDLGDLLPGRYNNAAQAEEDAKAGNPTHTALAMEITRVDFPLLSDYVFYVQQTAADDPRRIVQQRLITFEAIDDGRIVQRIHQFDQPQRWRDGQLNPGLFKSLMVQDTKQMAGCDLDWKKDGDKWTAQNLKDTCRVTSGSLGSVKIDMKVELSADELNIAELSYGPGGKLVQGNATEPFYRFVRDGS